MPPQQPMAIQVPQVQYQPMMAVDNGMQNMQQPVGYMRTLGAAINNQNTVATQAPAPVQNQDSSEEVPKKKSDGEKLDDEEDKDSEKDDKEPERKMEVAAKTSDNYDDDDDDKSKGGRSLQNGSTLYKFSVMVIMALMLILDGGW